MSHNSKYALTELLICGCCCTPYKRVTWSKKGKKKIVWRCISRLDHGTKYCKESPTIEEERLHTAVLKAINDLMSKRDQLVNIVKTNLAVTLSGQDSDDLNPLIIENRIRELESLTLELVDIIYKEKNAAAYEDKLRAITEEIKVLKEKQDQYQAELNSRDDLNRQMDDISRALEDAPFEISEYKDNIVRQFIDTIKVLDENNLLIVFKNGIKVEQPLVA